MQLNLLLISNQKNKQMKKLLFACILLCIASAGFSQAPQVVKWEFDTKQEGKNAKLIIKATIDKGWHLYNTQLPEGGPIPTTFTFNETELAKFIGDVTTSPKPIEKFDSSFQMDLSYFDNEVVFTQNVKLLTDNPVAISGNVRFMCCNDETCLPPKNVEYSFKLNQ